jgi:hypothetical protein
MFFISGLIDIGIFFYTLYFLSKVRFYHCIKQKMKDNIHFFSWAIIVGGISSLHASYYAFRAVFRGFDSATKSFAIIQIFAWLYASILFIFHIKKTHNEKMV